MYDCVLLCLSDFIKFEVTIILVIASLSFVFVCFNGVMFYSFVCRTHLVSGQIHFDVYDTSL